tara:strand:+ start:247 stop:1788 length:1542 start_codon:yes stop_codon:yes gene_type:complete
MNKSSKLILYILLILFIFSKSAYSKSRCENYYNQIKNAELSENLNDVPIIEDKTVGFQPDVEWDGTKDENYGDWVTKKDRDGYPYVGKILIQKLIGKINIGDLILEVNGKDVRGYKLEQDDLGTFSENFDKDDNEFKLKDKNGKIFKIRTKKEEISASAFTYDLFINYININDKKGTFEINFKKEYLGSLSNDHSLFKYAKSNLLYKDDKGDFSYEECVYTTDKWRELDYVLPDYGIVFNNVVKSDQTLQNEDYFIHPIFKEVNSDLEESYIDIYYRFEGTKTIRNNFNLRAFPFDRQILSLSLYQSRYSLEQSDTAPTDWTQRDLERYANQKDPIQGWKIVDYKMNYKPNYDSNYDDWSDGIEYKIVVERKSKYYVFKIILPIILILIVCWSSIYITPREIESRLTITIVCLLSLIAYNFVIDSDLPKLEYLTIMDHIILLSYIYAAIPNFLSIYSHHRLMSKNTKALQDIELLGKRYGLSSYIFSILIICIININSSPENTSAALSWMSLR